MLPIWSFGLQALFNQCNNKIHSIEQYPDNHSLFSAEFFSGKLCDKGQKFQFFLGFHHQWGLQSCWLIWIFHWLLNRGQKDVVASQTFLRCFFLTKNLAKNKIFLFLALWSASRPPKAFNGQFARWLSQGGCLWCKITRHFCQVATAKVSESNFLSKFPKLL